MAEMDSTLNRSLHAYIDLNIRRESGSVLNSLRNILSEKYGFNFPMFDLAFYVYAKKTGEKLQQDTAEGLIDKSPFLGTVSEVLGEIPIIGILKKLDKCAGYVKSLIDKRKRDLTAIETEPLDVIYRRLPYYFSLDISDNLEKSDTPLVIFIDTYETLVNEMAGVGEPSNHDLWIRGDDGLVQNSQRVMWVIAGREKLRWADINSDWNDSIEQHMLGNLSYSDAKYFLNSAGIYDGALTEAIYDLTSGTPVFLDLCVDNYYSIIERGKTPAIGDFKGNTTVIIERFLRYMDDSRKDLTYLLSCLKVWDDDTFHTVAGEVMPGYSFTTYERIKGASFVIRSNDGNYTMHQTVQSVVYSACPEFIREKANNSLNRYYSEALSKYSVTSPEFSVNLSRYAGLIVSRSYNEENFSRIYSGLEKHLNAAMDSCRFDLLLSCMEMMTDYAEKSIPDTAITARLYNDYAKYLAASGKYTEAITKARAAEKIYREIFGEINEHTLEAVDTESRCLYLAILQGT
ncbi:MAG: hypothetical protein IJR27_04335, partial [Synergistaceae bacterium]|nr:hypothetical protein [Synergistaceae bacterium]